MDIMTKIRLDHHALHMLLQQIIQHASCKQTIHPLWEDFLEEIDEHRQAEYACVTEIIKKRNQQLTKTYCLIDYKKIDRFFLNPTNIKVDTNSIIPPLPQQLVTLQQKLLAHSYAIEDVLSHLSQECLNTQQSEELSAKFEDEKITVLANSITYA